MKADIKQDTRPTTHPRARLRKSQITNHEYNERIKRKAAVQAAVDPSDLR
jgi:hypothetical protein